MFGFVCESQYLSISRLSLSHFCLLLMATMKCPISKQAGKLTAWFLWWNWVEFTALTYDRSLHGGICGARFKFKTEQQSLTDPKCLALKEQSVSFWALCCLWCELQLQWENEPASPSHYKDQSVLLYQICAIGYSTLHLSLICISSKMYLNVTMKETTKIAIVTIKTIILLNSIIIHARHFHLPHLPHKQYG